jgi:hypothetical protein
VSDISEWLDAKAEELERIANSTGMEARLVHMMATLVLADFDDDEIDAQLFGHGFSLNHDPERSAHLGDALKNIRQLASRTWAPK